MGTLDYGRDKADTYIRELGNDWWEAARVATPPLLIKAIRAQASANSVDVGYLRWNVMSYTKGWRRLSGAGMLIVARKLHLEAVNREHKDRGFTVPEDMASERRVNKALEGLIKWAKGPYADAMAKLFTGLAGTTTERIKASMLEEHGERMTTQQARRMILVELPLRVKDHPHWFRDPTTLRLFFEGVIG